MSLSGEEIIKIMERAKELGFNTIKVEGLELNGLNKAVRPTQEVSDDVIKKLSTLDDMSDDEILYWSTPFYDELEELRLGKNKKEE